MASAENQKLNIAVSRAQASPFLNLGSAVFKSLFRTLVSNVPVSVLFIVISTACLE